MARMTVSVAFAIILTPLDGSFSGMFDNLIGGIMRTLWFFAVLKYRKITKSK
ncbi:MAG: hypothetical protein J6X60_11880 [Ruminiclostridium sp.]|nr:hypothetical protein [Ruminiclostridium sp.]